jgi:hypothetical protein
VHRRYLFFGDLCSLSYPSVEFALVIMRGNFPAIILPVLFCRNKTRASGVGIPGISCCKRCICLSDRSWTDIISQAFALCLLLYLSKQLTSDENWRCLIFTLTWRRINSVHAKCTKRYTNTLPKDPRYGDLATSTRVTPVLRKLIDTLQHFN